MPHSYSNVKPTLVIVDDDPDQLSLFRIAAERVGTYSRIITAENGMQALREVLAFPDEVTEFAPIIILTDLRMPQLNGVDLARRLHRQLNTPSLRLIAMSNSSYPPDVEAALAAGCCAFIQKPSGFPELKRMVASLPEVCQGGDGARPYRGEPAVSFA